MPSLLPLHQPPLALTMGDPAGIGGEITVRAWAQRAYYDLPPFYVIDDPNRLRAIVSSLRLPVSVHPIERPADATVVFGRSLPVLPHPLGAPAVPGRPDARNAPAILAAIERAVDAARAGEAAGIVTNPIHKASLYDTGFPHPGHTEYLAALLQASQPPIMMLVCEELRVVPATIHLPLAQVPGALSHEALVTLGRAVAAALIRDFGIAQPRLALAGLNPHAGEGGTLGREEIEIIAPAAEDLRREGILIHGPAPADTLFHAEARRAYDAAICMYHDQALIPLKTIDFAGGVNITLGLPIVRTSPDHGTAFDIAGAGQADPASLIAAIGLAGEIAERRHMADSGG